MFDFECYRTYKKGVLFITFRKDTPPPWHTQKGANILIMDCNTNSQ